MSDFVQKYVYKKLLDFALENLKSRLSKQSNKIVVSDDDLEKSINYHVKEAESWSSIIGFKDLKEEKSLLNVYVDLNYYVVPRKQHYYEEDKTNRIVLKDIFKEYTQHLVILGQPGAGKTTTVKKIVQSVIHDEDFYPDLFSFPIVIRLKELNNYSFKTQDIVQRSLIYKLYDILGLRIDFGEKGSFVAENKDKIIRESTIEFVDDLNVLIIVDGYDELNVNLREYILDELQSLCRFLTKSRVIVTSRIADFKTTIENTKEVEICALTEEQIKDFIKKWLHDTEKGNVMYDQLRKSPFADTALRPLNLAHLCALYERYLKIPEKPKTVYRKIINLLIEEWDLQRNITRTSSYGQFEADRKFDYLSHLAFYLRRKVDKLVFDQGDIEIAYKDIASDFNLPVKEYKKVASELESHTGLIIQSGYNQYEFAHKSLQEYLAAEYIVKLPNPPVKFIKNLPDELALSTVISSDQSYYFSSLCLNTFGKLQTEFIKTYLNRLIIEKPDFRFTPALGLGIMQLYSQVLINDGGDSEVEGIIDQLIKEFEPIKMSLRSLDLYYEVTYNVNQKSYQKGNLKLLYDKYLNLKNFESKLETILDSGIYLIELKTGIEDIPFDEIPHSLFVKKNMLVDWKIPKETK